MRSRYMLDDLFTALRSTSARPYLDKLQAFLAADPALQAVVRDVGKLIAGLAEGATTAPASMESVGTPGTAIAPATAPGVEARTGSGAVAPMERHAAPT